LIKVISDLWREVYDLEFMFSIDLFIETPIIGPGHFNSRPSNVRDLNAIPSGRFEH
jgi:hypothetical protein